MTRDKGQGTRDKGQGTRDKGQGGFALTMVIVLITVLLSLSAAALGVSYNFKQIADASSGARIESHYRAQAGITDAQWRIRTNTLNDIVGLVPPAGGFGDRDFTVSYYLDIDANPPAASVPGIASADCLVTIGAVSDNYGTRVVQASIQNV